MLKTMRESFHKLKWTLFAVILVFVLGFVFFSGGGGGGKDSSGAVVAKVGGDSISAVDFDRQYRAQLQNQQRMYQGNLSPELIRAMDLPRQVLDGMIDRILRLESARRMHLKVSDQEVAQKIASYPAFQQNGQFVGRDQYERFLRGNNYTPDRFEDEVREDLLLEKYSTLVKSSVLVSDTDVQREFASRNEKASIEYIKIPSSRLENAAQPTDAELKAYFDKHKERYRATEQRRIKYLIVERGKVRGKTVVPDPELRADYESRKGSFSVPEQVVAAHILVKTDPAAAGAGDAAAREKADKLAERAKKGEDFAKLANENTDDPSGKGSGGQLPPFAKGQMVPEFEEAAFNMAPGEIRGPIKTQFGYHVIKLVSKTPPHTRTFEEMRTQIASELTEKRVEAETDRRARALADRVKGMSSTSDDELRKLQDDVVKYETSEWVSRGEPITGLGANPRANDEAWSLKVGQISKDPVTTPRGPALIRPSEERPAGIPTFEELKGRLSQDFLADRREREAQEKLAPAAKELGSGTTLAALAARYETEVKTTPEFGPGGAIPEIGNAPALATAVFQTAKGQSGPPVSVPGGFVLFRVLSRSASEPAQLAAQRDEILETLRSREAERLLRSYLLQLRADRKVEVNDEILKTFLPEPGAARRG
ncbi:MAG: SurA N-terminal domain-containing protein [Acidobacteria bacterium]|nr:SurA N-terminal domain-containing protein [Acidobacteriota bacterium]MCA1611025.1 SurA N-terminal domain-containing protein [Acidobacteriota bacterium]